MIGDLCREAAVLIGVLAPMEMIIAGGGLTMRSVTAIVVLTAVLGALGLWLGLRDEQPARVAARDWYLECADLG